MSSTISAKEQSSALYEFLKFSPWFDELGDRWQLREMLQMTIVSESSS